MEKKRNFPSSRLDLLQASTADLERYLLDRQAELLAPGVSRSNTNDFLVLHEWIRRLVDESRALKRFRMREARR